jgi:formylglycine-generating enzyme required for sulfatase activity
MEATYPDSTPSSAYGAGASYPVYYVSWEDIVGTSGSVGYTINGISYYTDGFCYKLSQLAGGGKQFCLPTEAEWEYAAKGGQQTHSYTHSGSNMVSDVAWCSSNSGSISHPVGTKAANELGIYDMSGNVSEWCSDWYGSSYPSRASNPTGATTGSFRVERGGSWPSAPTYCTVSYRDFISPSTRYNVLGFRLALP